MRFIGNKKRLLDFINHVVEVNNLPVGTFCDIFSGTTNVAKFFKKKGYKVISNDFMTFSFALQKAFIDNNREPKFDNLDEVNSTSLKKVIDYLNNLDGEKDFIYKYYCKEGSKKYSKYERNYFSSKNAQKIDAIRNKIEKWRNNEKITENEFYLLLAALIDEVPSVSNVAGTYGAFLKKDDPRMYKELDLKTPEIIKSDQAHACYNLDSNNLMKEISSDILYIDPPYNSRQYASNYHILESVAVWDKKIRDNTKTGLRPYDDQKSDYCYKNKCIDTFKELISSAKTKYILLSYSTDGLMNHEDIIHILSNKGKVEIYSEEFKRYKSQANIHQNKEGLRELIYFVEVE